MGLANNGDGARLMCQVAAAANGPPAGSAQWYFVRLHYPVTDPDEYCGPYRTTQLLQLRLTAWLHSALGLPGALDLRLLIIEDCLLIGIALGAMAWLLRRMRLAFRLPLLAGTFAVLGDATFADYAASPYSDPAALIGLLGFALAAVAATAGRRRGAALLLATLAAALAVAAKPSTATLALPLAGLLAAHRLDLGRLHGRLGSRVLPAAGACVVLLAAVWVTSSEADWYEKVNVSNVVTKKVMPRSSDPGAVAADLGLPRTFGRYSGTDWWSAQPIQSDPEYASHEDLISRRNLAGYLLDHPATTGAMLSDGARDYFAFRPDYLGTYTQESGARAGAQECRLCLLPAIFHTAGAGGFPGLVTLWLAGAAAAIALIRRSRPGTTRRGFAQVALALVGCTAAQYVTAVFGDGVETTKHLAVGLFAVALVPVWLLAAALAGSGGQAGRCASNACTTRADAGWWTVQLHRAGWRIAMRQTSTGAATGLAVDVGPAADQPVSARHRLVLRELVADGTLTASQAETVQARLDEASAAGDRAAGPQRWLAEAAGYLGGTLTFAGGAMLVGLSWQEISRSGRVTVLAAATALLIAAAVAVAGGPRSLHQPADAPSTARRRVASVLFAVSAGTAALSAVVAVTAHQAVAAGAAGLAVAAAGYLLLPTMPLLLATAAFSVFTGTAVTGDLIGDTPLKIGLAMVTVAAAWAALGVAGMRAHRPVALVVAAVVGLVGAQQPLGEAGTAVWAYLLSLLVALACVAGYARYRQVLLLAVSVLAVTVTVSEAVADWTNGAAGGAAAVLTAGVVLLLGSGFALRVHRRRVGSASATPR